MENGAAKSGERRTTHGPGWRRRLVRYVLLLGVLAPSLVYLLHLPQYGACQYNDYYGIINGVREGVRFSHDPLRWLTLKSNEHTVTLPALVYLANIHLTHGDNRGLSAFSIGLLVAVLLMLCSMVSSTLDLPPPMRWATAFLVASAVFSPVTAHSVVMGFSGTIWFLSNLFSVTALLLLSRPGTGGRPAVWPVLLVGGLGALSYSTNLSLWPALLVAAVVLRRPRRVVGALAVAGVVVVLFFSLRFHPLPYHPPLDVAHPLVVSAYSAVYLGGFLAGSVAAAAVAGTVGVLSSVALWVVLLRGGRARGAAPWIGLHVYVLGNAVGTAVGRAGFGLSQALTSRYTSLSGLFWISWAVLLALAVKSLIPGRRLPLRRVAWAGLGLLVGGVVGLSWIRGFPVFQTYLRNARRQPLAAEALRLGVFDLQAIRVVTYVPVTRAEVEYTASFLKALHHVPFERPPQSWTGLPQEISLERGPVPGAVGRVAWVGGDAIRVSGWVDEDEDPVVEVVLIDGQGKPLARMVTGLPASGVPPGGDRPRLVSGWAGYLPPGSGAGRIRAVVRLRSGVWRPIPGEVVLPRK